MEVGVVGATIYLLLSVALWRDVLWLTKQKDFRELLGHAWTTFIALLIPRLSYRPLFVVDEIAAPLWFYAGVVVTPRTRALAFAFAAREKRDERHILQKVSLPGVN